METKIEREVRWLKAYAVVMTLGFAVFMVSAFAVQNKNKRFEELDVERINIVEKDGRLKMVLSNKERQHPGAMDGKVYNERKGQRPAGMIFFNDKGDEIGGLVYSGDTGKGQNGSLTFDRFRGDQTIQFLHAEESDGKYFSGLRLNDQNTPITDLIAKSDEISKPPTKEQQQAAYKEAMDKGLFMQNRLDIARGYDRSAYIRLKDDKGRTRVEISVKANGDPRLNFFDEGGKVIYTLPDSKKP